MEAIVALDINNGLSKNRVIPWKNKKDMSFFCELTKNNIIVMGKNTFFSLPNREPLKHKFNVVLTSHPHIYKSIENSFTNLYFTQNEDIYDFLFNYNNVKNKKIIIIGGKQIYEKYLDYCEVVWVTRIKKDYHCDLFLNYSFDDEHKYRKVVIYEDDEIEINKYILF
jgi:dihydrofolate reductase